MNLYISHEILWVDLLDISRRQIRQDRVDHVA